MKHVSNPIANPMIVFREEFDDWAILFDPDTGKGYGLDPIAVFIWKRLDGQHTTKGILKELCKHCRNVPRDAEEYIANFVKDLIENGLAGHQIQWNEQ